MSDKLKSVKESHEYKEFVKLSELGLNVIYANFGTILNVPRSIVIKDLAKQNHGYVANMTLNPNSADFFRKIQLFPQ
ncbi:hypothetical protein BpHYR1_012396 [Brachionus plicatilis]|uniref:Uncharacterized protein n=1 Tax=Brachionus plicatilis TaxID=10195 RepID=A0A3M7Q4P7_BRAPC|nr:hypothetical protein BpHYR1_012396 [Brachionus plicatilis]